jgi:hypothetical protein
MKAQKTGDWYEKVGMGDSQGHHVKYARTPFVCPYCRSRKSMACNRTGTIRMCLACNLFYRDRAAELRVFGRRDAWRRIAE